MRHEPLVLRLNGEELEEETEFKHMGPVLGSTILVCNEMEVKVNNKMNEQARMMK